MLTIRLHPADIEVLSGEGQERPAGLPLIADPSLGRGDAKVEYQHGWFDASLRTALGRARAALLGDAASGDAVLGDSLLGESGQAEFDASAYRGQA
jgi:flagellar assembly protein FliH